MDNLSRRAALVGIAAFAASAKTAAAASNPVSDYTRTAGGLTVYLGVVPAEIIRGHPSAHPERKMHGGPPRGPHQYHVIAAIFDAASGTRISDATVMAKISGLGLSGPETTLEPMKIADTTTYGTFVYLPGTDLYTITLTIQRPGSMQPVVLDFKYDHRRE